jgi:superfamily II DNA/RNA helicase
MSETPTTIEAGGAPTVRFADFGLAPEIQRALSDQGYVHPTPIQAQAIPIVLQGRDVMGAAQTGTGKTASFSLPIIQLLLPHANTSMSPARHAVRALVLTPTRELAIQVAENVKAYAQHTPLRSTVVFGGMDMKPQTEILRRGVEIVIATPGRLLDHVEQKNISLAQVQMLVMDEADRMLDMGFLPDLQRIINLLPKKRQNLMFSATFSPEIKKLASSFLNDPLTIEVARSNATNTSITQVLYKVDEEQKRNVVEHLIRARDLKQVLVFSNTKIGASRLARYLEQAGIKASAIHGDKTQQERIAALDAFKNGDIDVLVATDVAARGLDITDLPCVINYDLPYNAEDYVHRIGRTGRAGASGEAIALYTPSEERLLLEIEKLIKRPVPRGQLDVPAELIARSRGHGDEGRGGRAGREERQGREGRESRGRQSGDRRYGESAPRQAPVDDFFFKPYEPSNPALVPAAEKADQAERAAPKRKVAVLLGGSRK